MAVDLIDPTDPTIVAGQYGIGGQAIQIPTPTGAFVISINTVAGEVTLTSNDGSITITPSGSTLSLEVDSVSVLKITGLGAMATKGKATNPGALALTAGAAYVQADFQSVIDKLNALIANLLSAQHTV